MREAIRKWLGIDTDIDNAAMIARAECSELRDQQAANALAVFERLNKQDDGKAALVLLHEQLSKRATAQGQLIETLNERTREQYADIVDLQTRLLAVERKAEDRTPRAASINRLRAMISEQGGIKDNLPSEVAS